MSVEDFLEQYGDVNIYFYRYRKHRFEYRTTKIKIEGETDYRSTLDYDMKISKLYKEMLTFWFTVEPPDE